MEGGNRRLPGLIGQLVQHVEHSGEQEALSQTRLECQPILKVAHNHKKLSFLDTASYLFKLCLSNEENNILICELLSPSIGNNYSTEGSNTSVETFSLMLTELLKIL